MNTSPYGVENLVLDLTFLNNTVKKVMALVLADIPVSTAQASVIDTMKSISYRGSHLIFTAASVVELCTKMENDQWFRHVVMEASERLNVELHLLGISDRVKAAVVNSVILRKNYYAKEGLLDARVTAPLRLPDDFKDVILSNDWLLTIYLFVVSGSIHSITDINQLKENQGAVA